MKRSLLLVGVAVLVAAAATLGGSVESVAGAPACTGGGTTQICNGTVLPASGTTSTLFTFSIVYQDARGQRPSFARLTISGVGTFDMSPSGTVDDKNGTKMVYPTTLPVGSYTYSFAARRSGPRQHISNPSPSPVTVLAPTPTPTPTPRPTPTPTPTPTPKPTAVPTPSASPPTSPPVTPSSSPSASPDALPVAGGTGTAGGAGTTGPGDGGAPNGLPGWFPRSGPPLWGLLTAAAVTGMLLMLVFARRRRRAATSPAGDQLGPLTLAPAMAMAGSPASPPIAARRTGRARKGLPEPIPEPAPAAVAAMALPPDVPIEEAHLPRWRRPSLKAARAWSERAAPAPAWQLAFEGDAGPTAARRQIRYDLVPLLDAPDEIQSREIAQLQANDQVEVVRTQGSWVAVRTPLGVEGWVHRTTLAAAARALGAAADDG